MFLHAVTILTTYFITSAAFLLGATPAPSPDLLGVEVGSYTLGNLAQAATVVAGALGVLFGLYVQWKKHREGSVSSIHERLETELARQVKLSERYRKEAERYYTLRALVLKHTGEEIDGPVLIAQAEDLAENYDSTTS